MRPDFTPPPTFFFDAEGGVHRDLGLEAMAEALQAGTGTLWVDIDSRVDEHWALLGDLFGFHPLAIEDTRSPNCRVKLEEYEGYLFIVVRAVRFAVETAEPYDIDTDNLYLFLGANYVVTVHAGPSIPVATAVERIAVSPEPLVRDADQVAYLLLDMLVDRYFPCLDQIDDFIDEFERKIFEDGAAVLAQIFELKRSLLALRRHLAPTREVMATLANRPSPYLRPEVQLHFRDVYDHVVRQVESVETYREFVTGLTEIHLSLISNRVNEVVKVLSVIATVVLPPTLVASIYGMNFAWMPGLHHPQGFWIALLAMLVITLGLLAWLRRKGWV